jgi:hypothetical protein
MLVGKTLMQKHRPGSQTPDEEFGEEASGVVLRECLNLGQWALLSLLTMVLLISVGFEAAGFFVISALMLYTRLRNYLLIALTAGLLPFIVSYLIRWVFGIEVP